MRFRFSFLAFCCLALCSFPNCKKEPVQPAPAPWNAASGFLYYNRFAFNSAIWDDQLYVLNNNYLYSVTPDGSTFSNAAVHGEKFEFPLPLNREFFMATEHNPDVLTFIPSANPDKPAAKRIQFKMSDLAPDIAGFTYGYSRQSFVDNGQGQVLAIFRTTSDRQALFLFDVKVQKNELWEVEEVTFRRINLPESYIYTGTSVINNQFLVRSITNLDQQSTLLINTTGNVSVVAPEVGLFPVLPIGDTLFAYEANAKYISTNQGNSWVALQGNNPGLDLLFSMEGYTTIDNRLVMYSGYGIYQIERSTEGKISQTVLDLIGLEGNAIINIHEWRGQVFAVTLTGVYMRSVQDFFTKREY